MTYQEAVKQATAALNNISETPTLEAQLLVSHSCNIDATTLIAHPEKKLINEENLKFNEILKRRCQGEPLAYITGTKEFWSLNFLVNEHVLIPRPETELLVENALNLISKISTPRVLDLGTGCGAIAIPIAKECKRCFVCASDLSPSALDVAKINATKHGVGVTFIHSDWYEKLNDEKFDVIVCNPPYVATDDPNLDHYVTKYEPTMAVISKNNGLHDIEMVVKHAKQFLKPSGHLLIEHGFEQKLNVQKLFQQFDFKSVHTLKDLMGHDRATCGNA